ncbi:MAG: OmpH family outer membrane protein [Pseudomonadota bacterium]
MWRLALLCLALLGPVHAQPAFQTPGPRPTILILDQDRIFGESDYGRALQAQDQQEADALRAEGQALERAFEAEEIALTERREALAPEAFRELADAFDAKVVATREAQEQKRDALVARSEQRRRDFFQEVGPILLNILEQTGASILVDERSVLVSKQDLNITEEVIKRLDAAFAAGQLRMPAPTPPATGGADQAQDQQDQQE